MEVAAFWIVLGGVIIAAMFVAKSKYEVRHQTIRYMLEKGEKVDENLLAELLRPTPTFPEEKPGSSYRGLRIAGVICLFLAPGIAAMLALIGLAASNSQVGVVGLAIGVILGMLGAGLHFSARYVAPPPPRDAPPG